MFVDKVSVVIKAGDGGDGITSFHHEKSRPRGGPDGGDGGDGGDVILIASRNQNTLAAFRYNKMIKAPSGQQGRPAKRHGKSGKDLEVNVPVGTIVFRSDGEALADLNTDGQKIVIARGGRGGFGNAHFVSSVRQAPRVAEKGEKGTELEAALELKMIADVGIVGLPNAGKSTLLSVISNAKPEIANYPFTTLVPNLGVVDVDKQRSLLFADIPGLIEGASEGKGLGDEFLRHVERTSVLLHLIDIYGEVEKSYKTINEELAAYTVDLSKKPQIVALTKSEGLDKKITEEHLKKIKKVVRRGTPVMAISSTSGEGVKVLLREVLKQVDKHSKKSLKQKINEGLPVITFKEDDTSWRVEKVEDDFVVTGRRIEKFAHRTKFGDFHGEQRLRDIMKKMGIIRELERRGIKPDNKIIIGSPKIGQIIY